MTLISDNQIIRCYLNSKLLGERRIGDFSGGKVGLGVGGISPSGSAVIHFDNFEFRVKP